MTTFANARVNGERPQRGKELRCGRLFHFDTLARWTQLDRAGESFVTIGRHGSTQAFTQHGTGQPSLLDAHEWHHGRLRWQPVQQELAFDFHGQTMSRGQATTTTQRWRDRVGGSTAIVDVAQRLHRGVLQPHGGRGVDTPLRVECFVVSERDFAQGVRQRVMTLAVRAGGQQRRIAHRPQSILPCRGTRVPCADSGIVTGEWGQQSALAFESNPNAVQDALRPHIAHQPKVALEVRRPAVHASSEMTRECDLRPRDADRLGEGVLTEPTTKPHHVWIEMTFEGPCHRRVSLDDRAEEFRQHDVGFAARRVTEAVAFRFQPRAMHIQIAHVVGGPAESAQRPTDSWSFVERQRDAMFAQCGTQPTQGNAGVMQGVCGTTNARRRIVGHHGVIERFAPVVARRHQLLQPMESDDARAFVRGAM